MEEHRPRRQQPHRPTQLDVNLMSDSEMERYDIFTPDEEYFTPPNATTASQSAAYSQTEYQPRTLKTYNLARQTVLPLFPPRSTLISMVHSSQTATAATMTTMPGHTRVNEEKIDFLLCNVPKQLLTLEQYQRRQMNTYIPTFELRTWDELKKKNYHSFMLTFHKNMYIQLSKQWHIDIPILDYNLARLYECVTKNGFQFSFNDLSLALEFFLQMDVDLFHLKTCAVRQGQPRTIIDENGQQSSEGIFTIDRQLIEGRYGLTPCNRNNCLSCKNHSLPVQFNPKQIHCFLNRYQAILNCPVVSRSSLSFIHTEYFYLKTCTTANIIYALTCPCGQKDYVSYTNLSFVDCLTYHRQEIARTIREFLLGDVNVNINELKSKSEETIANDKNWLYQHSARCPAVIQLFLDRNPIYWCSVPIPIDRTLRANTYAPPQTLPESEQITTTTATLPMIRRSDTLSMRLANNIPSPTGDYIFKHQHLNEQKLFFKYGKDHDPINVHKLNFYNATIVAVLPDHCSDMVKKFIESLFITHGECELNKDGRLTNQQFFHGYPVRGEWYRDLTRRPSSIMMS